MSNPFKENLNHDINHRIELNRYRYLTDGFVGELKCNCIFSDDTHELIRACNFHKEWKDSHNKKPQWFKATKPLPDNHYFWRPDKDGKRLILWVINGEIYEHGTTRIRTGFSWGEWCGPIKFPD